MLEYTVLAAPNNNMRGQPEFGCPLLCSAMVVDKFVVVVDGPSGMHYCFGWTNIVFLFWTMGFVCSYGIPS
jgi:hypothetical protein